MIRVKLIEIKSGGEAIVDEIEGGWGARQRLNQMGIHPGDRLMVKRSSKAHGPVLIRIHGTDVAVGRGMAQKVIVMPAKEYKSEREN